MGRASTLLAEFGRTALRDPAPTDPGLLSHVCHRCREPANVDSFHHMSGHGGQGRESFCLTHAWDEDAFEPPEVDMPGNVYLVTPSRAVRLSGPGVRFLDLAVVLPAR